MVAYHPQAEVPTRVSEQLLRIATFVPYLLDRKNVGHQTIQILHKVVMDTCKGYRYDLLKTLYNDHLMWKKDPKNHHVGFSAKNLVPLLGISQTQISHELKDCKALKILESSSINNGSGRRGANAHIYTLTDNVVDIFKKSQLTFEEMS